MLKISVFKLGAEHRHDVLQRLILKVYLLKQFRVGIEYGLGRAESHILEGLDDPAFDFIAELIEIDIFLTLFEVSVYVD